MEQVSINQATFNPSNYPKKEKFKNKLFNLILPSNSHPIKRNCFASNISFHSKENLSTFLPSQIKEIDFKKIIPSEKEDQKVFNNEEKECQFAMNSFSSNKSQKFNDMFNAENSLLNRSMTSMKEKSNPFLSKHFIKEPEYGSYLFSQKDTVEPNEKEFSNIFDEDFLSLKINGKRNYDQYQMEKKEKMELEIFYPNNFNFKDVKNDIIKSINKSLESKNIFVKEKCNSTTLKKIKLDNFNLIEKRNLFESVFMNTFLHDLEKNDEYFNQFKKQLEFSKNKLIQKSLKLSQFCKFVKYFHFQIKLEQKEYLNLKLSEQCKFISFIFTKYINKKMMLTGFGNFWSSVPITMLFKTHSKM